MSKSSLEMKRCICEFDTQCGGTGVLQCLGCGGDQCICSECFGRGEEACGGCGDCLMESLEEDDE